MRILNSWILVFACLPAMLAQEAAIDARSDFKVNFPPDSPVVVLSSDLGQSSATARGGALVVDLHSTLQLRNSGQRRIRGVTLLVLAQEVTPGGKGSVTVPSLDVEPGESFPVRIDLRLMRPLQRGNGALVEISLDGVLFDDMNFYGPNRLNSRRTMTAWELEARRDRKHLLGVLETAGADALSKELYGSLAGQPQLQVQFARARATNVDEGRQVEFAFLDLPDSPVRLLTGSARIAANEARLPRIEVQNRSKRPIRYVEVGWLVRDTSGTDFAGGSIPADVTLAPGQAAQITRDSSLRFLRPGETPPFIQSMTGYVSGVEFADGQMWVPSRPGASADARLARVLGGSPEQQRLAELMRRKGLTAVIQQLRNLQ